jgi:hypothetical protein
VVTHIRSLDGREEKRVVVATASFNRSVTVHVGTMGGKETETCGRCAMSSVVGVASADDEDGDERDPYAGARIEVDEGQLRAVSPAAWLGRVKRRLDDYATRLTYGR